VFGGVLQNDHAVLRFEKDWLLKRVGKVIFRPIGLSMRTFLKKQKSRNLTKPCSLKKIKKFHFYLAVRKGEG
jgi:hypothetical protein